MKIVFLSNYFNHHQKALSEALNELTRFCYRFIGTGKMRQDRRRLGYGYVSLPSYCIDASEGGALLEECFTMVSEADLVICGSAPESCIRHRLRSGKLTFRYSERPLKNGPELLKYVPRLLKWNWNNHGSKSVYMLCASAYTSGDYSNFLLYRNKAFKWGYFPETKKYDDVLSMIEGKSTRTIVWVGRFLDWKHPEAILEVASKLKADGCEFKIEMIGVGPLLESVDGMRKSLGLEDCVQLLGAMPPDEVRFRMEASGVFVFTSDRREGWGAVLNEAMNGGCAVVSSHLVGAAPYLIKNGENGYVYRSGDTEELYRKVKHLIENPHEQRRLGEAAYATISESWNAEVAADRLVNLAEHLLAGEKSPDLYEDGPCSRAQIIREDWYKGEAQDA